MSLQGLVEGTDQGGDLPQAGHVPAQHIGSVLEGLEHLSTPGQDGHGRHGVLQMDFFSSRWDSITDHGKWFGRMEEMGTGTVMVWVLGKPTMLLLLQRTGAVGVL